MKARARGIQAGGHDDDDDDDDDDYMSCFGLCVCTCLYTYIRVRSDSREMSIRRSESREVKAYTHKESRPEMISYIHTCMHTYIHT